MTKPFDAYTPRSRCQRFVAYLLVFAMLATGFPSMAFAQEAPPAAGPSPAEAARERLRRPAGGGGAPSVRSAAVNEFASTENEDGDRVYTLHLKDAPLDVLLDRYSEITGRTMIKAPGVQATVSFSGHTAFTRAEILQAMDAILTQQNIALVPLGTQFFRVVQVDKAPTEGMDILMTPQSADEVESDALVRRLVELKYLDLESATTLVQAMLHGFGKVQRLDRMNSLLILETGSNLSRILEILDMVDRPEQIRVETKIYNIAHAKAADIASRLNDLVSDSESKQQTPQVASPAPAGARRVPGMIRARQAEEAAAASSENPAALAASLARSGIIQGKVKILTDERTNIIIVISDPVNFAFFDRIVEVLDIPVEPEVIVEVVALEYANSEDTASLLNDFIGASTKEKDAPTTSIGTEGTRTSGARSLDEFVRSRAETSAATERTPSRDAARAVGEAAAAGKIGELSANTKILSDQRTNTLLLMGTKGDIEALKDVIKKVDIMLAQVLIEAVILEVSLNNSTDYGISWLQKSMVAYNEQNGARTPVVSWGGGFGGSSFTDAAGDLISRATELGSGLSYYLTLHDLNIDAVLKMVASSGESRVLATPVILTTDNTEASIISGQSVPIRTGDSSSYSGTYYSDYEYKDVGIELDVKPRINPSRYVTLELTQTANTLGDQVDVGNNSTMYTINKRELTASISVPSRSTIVLGGLLQTDYSDTSARIPFLGSIPVLGALFRNETKTRKRTELLVLITPYVLRTPEEARAETERLHRASNVTAEEWYRGWSDSPLAAVPRKVDKKKKSEYQPLADPDNPPTAVFVVDPTMVATEKPKKAEPAKKKPGRKAAEKAVEPEVVVPEVAPPEEAPAKKTRKPRAKKTVEVEEDISTIAPETRTISPSDIVPLGNGTENGDSASFLSRFKREKTEEPKPGTFPATEAGQPIGM